MAPEDNASSDGRTLDQKMIPGSQKTTYNMPHVFCNGGRNSNSRVLLLEDKDQDQDQDQAEDQTEDKILSF